MIGPASFSSAHRRVWDCGVLAVLIWVAFHLLGCVHGHGAAYESEHHTLNTLSVVAAPVAASGDGPTASLPQHAPCCPETGDHTVDRVRVDAPPAPVLGGPLPADGRPDALAALTAAGTARAPVHGAVGGRCILTALCVART